jgi:hypothetical protein
MIPRVKPEGMLFGKPVSTPQQVRGMLYPDHALGVEKSALLRAGANCYLPLLLEFAWP